MNSNKKIFTMGGLIILAIIVGGGIYLSFHKGFTPISPKLTDLSSSSSSTPSETGATLTGTAQATATASATAPETPSITTPIRTTSGSATNRSQSPVTQPSLPKATTPAPVATPLPEGTDQFTIELNGTTSDVVAQNLQDNGFITDQNSFITAATKAKTNFAPGAYKLSNTMTPQQILAVLNGSPYMKWLIIPEGLRKEEIATLLAKTLNWTTAKKQEFITATNVDPNYSEGVYFPDTYLIPVAEAPKDVANRLIAKFNEKFGALLPQFNSQNIKWTSGLTLASIVQREASNDADTALIAGILWNRLDQNMPLDVDATLQYVRGNTGAGFWAPITVADKKTDSPYNTYIHTGLPPHPISNPGIPAIKAVLNPASTTCLYYLHDVHRVTHCATTYEEHMANIQKYL